MKQNLPKMVVDICKAMQLGQLASPRNAEVIIYIERMENSATIMATTMATGESVQVVCSEARWCWSLLGADGSNIIGAQPLPECEAEAHALITILMRAL